MQSVLFVFVCIIPSQIIKMNCDIIILHKTSSQYTRAGVLGVLTTAGELEDDEKITNCIKYSLKETLEGLKTFPNFQLQHRDQHRAAEQTSDKRYIGRLHSHLMCY